MKQNTSIHQPAPRAFHVARPSLMNWSTMLFMWAGVVAVIANDGPMDWRFMFGVVFLFLTTTISYKNFQRGVRATLVLIFLGTIGWVQFFPVQYNLQLGSMHFDLIFLVTGLLHYYSNKSQLSVFFKGILHADIPEQEQKALGRSRINNFKTRFARKELSELAAMTQNPKLLPEAIQAAEELLEERAWV